MIYTTKKELAQAYCPDIDYTAALKKLQVKLLYHYLGEPF